MATMHAESSSAPVKVRNVSPRGALVEGAAIPPVGSRIRLVRASLSVTGEIVWTKGHHAGLRFESTVSVNDWLPRGRAVSAQQRVDEIVHDAKVSEPAPASAGGFLKPELGKISALQITQLRRAIESLAEDLVRDPEVVKRHMLKLQTLDITAQALRKLAAERDSEPLPGTQPL